MTAPPGHAALAPLSQSNNTPRSPACQSQSLQEATHSEKLARMRSPRRRCASSNGTSVKPQRRASARTAP
eukprot:2454891-Alexandrium_andersonii.AAC.1